MHFPSSCFCLFTLPAETCLTHVNVNVNSLLAISTCNVPTHMHLRCAPSWPCCPCGRLPLGFSLCHVFFVPLPWVQQRRWCLRRPPLTACGSVLYPQICPSAAPCAYSCFAYVRPCVQGRCGRCPPGSGVMSLFFSLTARSPLTAAERRGSGRVRACSCCTPLCCTVSEHGMTH